MKAKAFALKGNILHTPTMDAFQVFEHHYVIVEEGICKGVFESLPKQYIGIDVTDYGDCLIIPSFIDLHVHGPQYVQMGLGLNLPLIDWLQQYTFPNEAKFSDLDFAREVYPGFVDDLYHVGTLRSVIFGTIHNEGNKILVDTLANKGLSGFVGKVNMDRNSNENLLENSRDSLEDTLRFREYIDTHYEDSSVYSIVTPRFAPSCTPELMEGLGDIVRDLRLPVQSHLSETKREVEWVKSLYKDQFDSESFNYSDVYNKYHLYGDTPTVMAHGIYLEEEEIDQAALNKNLFIAHCPYSNMNLSSGIMPLAKYIDRGVQVGLGTDVGAGDNLSMKDTIKSALQNAKLRHVLYGERLVTESEVFYCATMINGLFFSKSVKYMNEEEVRIGCFDEGYSFDALVISDINSLDMNLSPLEKLQKYIYVGNGDWIIGRYLEGNKI